MPKEIVEIGDNGIAVTTREPFACEKRQRARGDEVAKAAWKKATGRKPRMERKEGDSQ